MSIYVCMLQCQGIKYIQNGASIPILAPFDYLTGLNHETATDTSKIDTTIPRLTNTGIWKKFTINILMPMYVKTTASPYFK